MVPKKWSLVVEYHSGEGAGVINFESIISWDPIIAFLSLQPYAVNLNAVHFYLVDTKRLVYRATAFLNVFHVAIEPTINSPSTIIWSSVWVFFEFCSDKQLKRVEWGRRIRTQLWLYLNHPWWSPVEHRVGINPVYNMMSAIFCGN